MICLTGFWDRYLERFRPQAHPQIQTLVYQPWLKSAEIMPVGQAEIAKTFCLSIHRRSPLACLASAQGLLGSCPSTVPESFKCAREADLGSPYLAFESVEALLGA
jgi:hypothetical protein